MKYRKKKGSDTWHFCGNCTQLPQSDYVEENDPTSGEKCNQCKSKQSGGDCTKL